MTRGRVVAALAALCVVVGATLLLTQSDDELPPDRAVRFVPRAAAAYVHLTTDRGDGQFKRFDAALRTLPSFELLRDDLLSRLSLGGRIELGRDVAAWLGGEAALAELTISPSERIPALAGGSIAGASVAVKRTFVERRREQLLLLASRDDERARRFIARATVGGRERSYGGTRLRSSGGLTLALHDGFVLIGSRHGVESALAARADSSASLGSAPVYRRLTDRLPERRVASAYLSRAGLASKSADPVSALADLAGGPPPRALAGSLGLEGSSGRLTVRALPRQVSKRPDECERGARGEPRLLKDAPGDTAALVEVARGDCFVKRLQTRPDSAPGRALRRFARAARERSELDFDRQLRPVAKGPAELLVTGSDAGPVLTLLLGEVDARRAIERMDGLQPALIALVGSPEELGRVPSFAAREQGSITAITSELSPGLELSYASFEDRFAVSTQPEGLRALRGVGGLERRRDFDRAVGDDLDDATAVLFLDLDRLLALGDQVGLSEDAGFLAIRDDLQKFGVVGAVFSREEDQTNAEIRFNIP